MLSLPYVELALSCFRHTSEQSDRHRLGGLTRIGHFDSGIASS
jgi:hypothetical protein